MKRLLKIGDKFLFGFSSQSGGFTEEAEFEGEVIDTCDGIAIVTSNFIDKIWVNKDYIMFISSLAFENNGRLVKVKKVCDDIRIIQRLRK